VSWHALIELMAKEVGAETAERIAERARLELGGLRITISTKPYVTKEIIDRVAPGNPNKAARKLGVSRQTIYNRLIR